MRWDSGDFWITSVSKLRNSMNKDNQTKLDKKNLTLHYHSNWIFIEIWLEKNVIDITIYLILNIEVNIHNCHFFVIVYATVINY